MHQETFMEEIIKAKKNQQQTRTKITAIFVSKSKLKRTSIMECCTSFISIINRAIAMLHFYNSLKIYF